LSLGAYGEVRKCQHKETKQLRAVKIINKKCLEEEEKEKLLNEITILKQMDHPNILKLYEFFQDEKRYFLVTE
jgi:calcium-dependent protein kinase